MAIRIKPGAKFDILREEIYSKLGGIEAAFKLKGLPITITCGTDSHPEDDPHTNGFAIDLRTNDAPDNLKESLLVSLQSYLGDKYTVLLENRGDSNEHIHVQVRKDLWRNLL